MIAVTLWIIVLYVVSGWVAVFVLLPGQYRFPGETRPEPIALHIGHGAVAISVPMMDYPTVKNRSLGDPRWKFVGEAVLVSGIDEVRWVSGLRGRRDRYWSGASILVGPFVLYLLFRSVQLMWRACRDSGGRIRVGV